MTARLEEVALVALPPSAWRELRALRLRALADDPTAFGASYADGLALPDAHWQERLAMAASEERSWYRFARAGDRLVGMIGAFLDEDAAAGDVAAIVAVYVAPEVRGRGVGQRLLAHILDILQASRRVRRVHLDVNAAQTAAQRLYRSAGFRETGRAVRVLGDGHPHEVLLMERDLP
jgi:ribosomal protein S18 acetylase RimI-like enzyme